MHTTMTRVERQAALICVSKYIFFSARWSEPARNRLFWEHYMKATIGFSL
jgi:hypothetical protein